MISQIEYKTARVRAVKMIKDAGIPVSLHEIEGMDIADFGLGRLETEGAQILTFFSTQRVAVKVIALFPRQTEPEHWHPAVGDDPGKEETLRCVKGAVRFGIPGEGEIPDELLPVGKSAFYTCRKEVILRPGDQITFQPGVKHWFQALEEGAVLYTFSSCARDALDQFTDPGIKRVSDVEKA